MTEKVHDLGQGIVTIEDQPDKNLLDQLGSIFDPKKPIVEVKLKGKFNRDNSDLLEDLLTTLTENNVYQLIIDMHAVQFLSSGSYWALIEANKEVNKGHQGKLVLANMSPKHRASLDLVGLGSWFTVVDYTPTSKDS